MGQQQSTNAVVEIFKKVYGNLNDLISKNYMFEKLVQFNQSAMIGLSYIESFILTFEVGITWAGNDQSAFTINPAVAGEVKQGEITSSQTVLSSVLPWGFMSRSAQAGEKAFANGTQHIMKNHIRSHAKFKEIERIYGQADGDLGYLTYAAAGTVYRGATYTAAGTVTLTKSDATTIAFTAGRNVASKAILFAPGQFAPGIWLGMKGCKIAQCLASDDSIVAQGSLVSADLKLGILYVDFAPAATTATDSHYITFQGWEVNNCMVGMIKQLTNRGVLFGINFGAYDLMKGNVIDLAQKRMNLAAVLDGISDACAFGGLEDALTIVVSFASFSKMSKDEAALRKYDASYKADATNGFEAIEYYGPNGLNQIVPYNMLKEGDAIGIVKGNWMRSGSAEISFKVPGFDKDVIFPLESQAGFMLRSYSDQYILGRVNARQVYWKNANPDGVSYG